MTNPISFEIIPENLPPSSSPSFRRNSTIDTTDRLFDSSERNGDGLLKSEPLQGRNISLRESSESSEESIPTQQELSELLKNLINKGIDISDESTFSITATLGNGGYNLETFQYNGDPQLFFKIGATYQISYLDEDGNRQTEELTRTIYTNVKSDLPEQERDVILSKLTASYTTFVIDFAKASNGLASTIDKKIQWDDFKDIATFSFQFKEGSEEVKSYAVTANPSASKTAIPLIDFKISKKFYEIDQLTGASKEIEKGTFKEKRKKNLLYKEIVKKPSHEIIHHFSYSSAGREIGENEDPTTNPNLKKEIEEKKQKLKDLKEEIYREICDFDKIQYDKKIIESRRKKNKSAEHKTYVSSSSNESPEVIQERQRIADEASEMKIDRKLASEPMQKFLDSESLLKKLIEILITNVPDEKKEKLLEISKNRMNNKSTKFIRECIEGEGKLDWKNYDVQGVLNFLKEYSDAKEKLYEFHQNNAKKMQSMEKSILEKEKIEKELSDLRSKITELKRKNSDPNQGKIYDGIIKTIEKPMK